MLGVALPARIVATPEKLGTHLATPLESTVAPRLMFPAQCPALEPTHQVISLPVSRCGEGGLLNVPVAEKGTCPLAKSCALAVAGESATDCSCRLPPHPAVRRDVTNRRAQMGPQVDALKEPPSVMVILSPMRAERGGVASAKRF
jgi:hypothetical protein